MAAPALSFIQRRMAAQSANALRRLKLILELGIAPT
jgi:hypothetical protein